MTEWFDTGREKTYHLTGVLELFPGAVENFCYGGTLLSASATSDTLGVLSCSIQCGPHEFYPHEASDPRQLKSADLVITAGSAVFSEVVDAGEIGSISGTYSITIHAKEQIRFGLKEIEDQQPPILAAEFRQVFATGEGEDKTRAYILYEVTAAGHTVTGWENSTLAGDVCETPGEILLVSSDAAAYHEKETQAAARAKSQSAGLTGNFLTGSDLNGNQTFSPVFTSDSVEMHAGYGEQPLHTVIYQTTCGPLWQIETNLALQKWKEPYSGSLLDTPFKNSAGDPVQYTSDSSGSFKGTENGRIRSCQGGSISLSEDTRPLRNEVDLSYNLNPSWMDTHGESHWEEEISADGRRFVVKRYDNLVRIQDPVRTPFAAATLSKRNEKILCLCEQITDWTSGAGSPPVAFTEYWVDGKGVCGIQADVSSEEGAANSILFSSETAASKHFRYLRFSIHPPREGDFVTLKINGKTLSVVPDSGEVWTSVIQEYPIQIIPNSSQGIQVISLSDGWYQVTVDLACSENPGPGFLLDQFCSLELTGLSSGYWVVDDFYWVTGSRSPQVWYAADQLTRQLGANLPDGTSLWRLSSVEKNSTGEVLANIYEDSCLILESNGCRCYERGDLTKRIPVNPELWTTYQIRTIQEILSDMESRCGDGWIFSAHPMTAPYDGNLWSLNLTADLGITGDSIILTCRPQYHVITLYPRDDWSFTGTKILQGMMEGILCDKDLHAPSDSVLVRLTREGTSVQGESGEDGYFAVHPVPHCDLVLHLPEGNADSTTLIDADTRYNASLYDSDGALLLEETKSIWLTHRQNLRKSYSAPASPFPERVSLEIGRIGSHFWGWSQGGTIFVKRLAEDSEGEIITPAEGKRPWIALREADSSQPLACCYDRDGLLYQRISLDDGKDWGQEMNLAEGECGFFKQDSVTGITYYLYWRSGTVYLKRSANGGVSFLGGEMPILSGISKQTVSLDFTKDARRGIRCLYKNTDGYLNTLLSLDGGLTWQPE